MPEQQKVDDVVESSIMDKKNLTKVEKSSTALENEQDQDEVAAIEGEDQDEVAAIEGEDQDEVAAK